MLAERISQLSDSDRQYAESVLDDGSVSHTEAAERLADIGLDTNRYAVRRYRQNVTTPGSKPGKGAKTPSPGHPSGFEPGVTWDGTEGVVVSKPFTGPLHENYDDLLTQWGFDPNDFEVLEPITFKTWLGYGKNAEGVLDTVQLWSYRANIRRRRSDQEIAEEWPLPAITIKVPKLTARKSTVKRTTGWRTAVVVPDVQIGYRQLIGADGSVEWDTIHDESAVDVAVQIAHDVNPDVIVDLGDRLDLAAFGRFKQEPGFANTLQKTLHRAGLYDGQLIACLRPGGEYVVIAGNHDERITTRMLELGGGLATVRPYSHSGASWPIASIPHLLGWASIDADASLTYVDGYPAGEWRFNRHLIARHGSYTGVQATRKEVTARTVSVIHGHTHHSETVYVTEEVDGRVRQRVGHSPGCLTRIDGGTPGVRGGMRADGTPQTTVENWQQGVTIVEYETDGEQRFTLRHIPIINGWASHEGREYRSKVDVRGNPTVAGG